MRDTELYRHLLGLVAPWEVSRIELSVDGERVDVWAEHPKRTRFTCPECDRELPVYDHAEERAWRHLDSCAVPHLPARTATACRVPHSRGAPGGSAVGRADEPLHRAVRAARHRRAERV